LIAEKLIRFGGIPLISSRDLQPFKTRRLIRWHSSRHLGRILKLFFDKLRYSTLANHLRIIGRHSSERLLRSRLRRFTFEDTVKLNFLLCFGNIRPSQCRTWKLDNFCIIEMLLESLSFTHPNTFKRRSSLRFWNENGNSPMRVSDNKSSSIFVMLTNNSGKLLRLLQ
jgi:hypothetical protein